MARWLLSLACALFIAQSAHADTHVVGPANCSAAAVNAAITAAVNGDMVQLTCTGTVTWTSTVSIPGTKGVILAVKGGSKATNTYPLTVTSSLTDPTIQMTIGANNALTRVTGFKFQNSATAGDSGFIYITGHGAGSGSQMGGFRFDNNYLDHVSGSVVVAVHSTNGLLEGLIDNNTFHDLWRADNEDYGPYVLDFGSWWNNGDSCWGEDGWTTSFTYGDKHTVFVEDNVFENVNAGYTRHFFSGALGGRYVIRYNTFTVNRTSPIGYHTDLIEGHGLCTCASTGCGTRGVEVYHNTIGGTEIGRHIVPRGGNWLIYDNTFLNLGTYSSPIYLMEYRAFSSPDCTVSCPCAAALGFAWHPAVTDGSHYPLPQQLANTYVWNNLYDGTNQAPSVDPAGVQTTYIQSGRDYFYSASKPGALASYTPYTYPHPLRVLPQGTNKPVIR